MSKILELHTFYKNIDHVSKADNNGIGHFNVFKIEDILQPEKKRKPTYNRRSFYKVSLITGHNKIHYADKCLEINGSALVFTNPTIPYFWDTLGQKQKGYMCIFTEPFFNRFDNIKDYPVFHFTDAAVIPLTKRQLSEYTGLFRKMHAELQGNYIYKYDLIRNLLMEIIHEAQKMRPDAATLLVGANAAERIAVLFAELLERQFPIELNYQVMQLHSPSAFAGQLNIHVNHLNKSLKEITGQTTSHHISERILQEAKVLLKSTGWTIAEIAFSLGFEESNHFSSFFKNKTKMTAKKYRELHVD